MDNSNISKIDTLEEEDQSPPSPTSTDFEIISNYEDDIISISSSHENFDESSDEESDSDDENPVELLNDSDFLYSDSDDNQTIYDGDLPRKSTSSEQQRSSDFLSDSNSFDNALCESHNPNDWCSKCHPNWLHNMDDSNIKNLSISQFLFNCQKISHCSSCTPTWFNFKGGFEPVMNNDGLLLAKPVFLKPGSKSLPGIKLNVVALKNIGLTSFRDEIYFSDLSKCKSCIYESGHVLPYYGVTFHPDNLRYMIVMPFLPNRNFREYLKHPDNFKSFTWSRRLSMLHTLANELANLHKLGIIHKNLHPNNILIGKDIEDPIISDVGLMPQLPYKNSSDEMCWDAYPENRPSMREIAGIFNYWRNNITIPGTNYGNYYANHYRTNEHNNVYKEFQKADEFRQDDFSSITRFSKLHIDAKYSSSFHNFKFPESIVTGNLYSHKQSVLSAPIRQHIIPDTVALNVT
ncbi:17210_t:CDS:2 [Dentiscutata erythropus]|uniref:17210_t:CDS:1 n=1 Tax=Dentiscutata erythropus TaxID=1348616 RepID=A0A9N9HZ65_9GLOM|nr:17210_t:CDS:2 [Dentiscutata erythropus]